MTVQEMKKAAFAAAKYENITADQYLPGMSVQESLYYMRMVYYYRLFDAGKIKVTKAKRVEQRILADFNRLDNALRLSQKNYQRQVHMALDCEMERTKLVKQLRAGDREFIVTLLNLLDLYTGEDIYARLYQISVLLSTRPEWCRLIFSGQKPVELRKNAPRLPQDENQFRVLVYESRRNGGCGAVVGEAVCFFVEKAAPPFMSQQIIIPVRIVTYIRLGVLMTIVCLTESCAVNALHLIQSTTYAASMILRKASVQNCLEG